MPPLAADIAAAQTKHDQEIAALRSSDAALAATDTQTSQTISDLEVRTQAAHTRLEKASAERRNALIDALRTRPVVLHRDVSCAVIPDINLVGVGMDLDGKVLLEDCTCSIVAGRRYGLVGKNGIGKTTLLRAIAGYLRPTTGIVTIAGTVASDERTWLPPERRRIGIVPQEGALFPHLARPGVYELRYECTTARGQVALPATRKGNSARLSTF